MEAPRKDQELTPRQKAAMAADNAKAEFQGADSILLHCTRAPVYGRGIKERPCPRCDKPYSDPGHMLAPDEKTIELADRICDLMLRFHKEQFGNAYDSAMGKEIADPDEREQYARSVADDMLYKAAVKGLEEEGGDEGAEDQIDSGTAYAEYVVGVMAAMTPSGGVEYYVACSGFKPTPAFKFAYRMIRNEFQSVGMLHPNVNPREQFVELPCIEAALEPDSSKVPKERMVLCEKISNVPGTCAAGQLIQCAIKRQGIPLFMREIWITPKNGRMGKGAESCQTCVNNLQPMLCGLALLRETRLGKLEEEALRQERFELEEQERLIQEQESKRLATQLRSETKAAVAKQNEDLTAGKWLAALEEVPLPPGVDKQALATCLFNKHGYFQDNVDENTARVSKISKMKPKDINKLLK